MFKIGEFSKFSNITVKMLRHYDEIGLLKPCKVEAESGYRYYSSVELERAAKINSYKGLGFSLKMIKNLIENEQNEDDIMTYYKIRIDEITEEQEKLERQIETLKRISKTNSSLIDYNVSKIVVPSRKVLSLRSKLASYSDEGVLWNNVYDFITKNKITPIYDGYTMTIYHDDEYKEKDIDVEIQITVESFGRDEGDFSFFETEESSVVSVTFNGSYDQMTKVIEAIAYYVEQNGLEITGEMFNIFHVSPAQTDDENKYITQACYNVK